MSAYRLRHYSVREIVEALPEGVPDRINTQVDPPEVLTWQIPRVRNEATGKTLRPRHHRARPLRALRAARIVSKGFRGRSQKSSIPLVGEGHTSGNRISAYQAAEVLGVTVDAIRKRISRGTIAHERDEDGRVWVILDVDQDATSKVQDTDQPQSDATALISEMRERIASLERQLEHERQANSEHRRLLAAALERIPPQLEAPQEQRDSPERAEAAPESVEPRPDAPGAQEGAERVSWWRRMFRG